MSPDQEALDSIDDKDKGQKALADDAVERCMRIVANCNRFKQLRLDQIQKYRDLYAGRVKKKFRQPFNVVLPVFSGAIDTAQADFNDDLALELEGQEPAVPADTKGGIRKISEGIYSFETPQLAGTINLIEWIQQTTGTSVGITHLSQGGVQNRLALDAVLHQWVERSAS
jgi:hypothetical protein